MNKGSDLTDMQQQKQAEAQPQYYHQQQHQQKRIFDVTEGIRAKKTIVTYKRILNIF
jgi:hypothetical protein